MESVKGVYMRYCVIGKGKAANEMANQVITNMLHEYSRELYDFTRLEFDNIVEYDILNIMSFFYSQMNVEQKENIREIIQKELSFDHMDVVLDDLSFFLDGEMFIPFSCKLTERLGDRRITTIIYETLFEICTRLTMAKWDENNSYSNYLMLLNVAYFSALSYKLHVKDSCKSVMKILYGQENYDDFIEFLYEQHPNDLDWDVDIELDFMDNLIYNSKNNHSFSPSSKGEFLDVVDAMNRIRREHNAVIIVDNGFEHIVQKTGIREMKCTEIYGFECHFCEARFSEEEYIIVYQKSMRINKIIDDEDKWREFQRELYKEDIRNNNSKSLVYIVYILDDNSENIPIQKIESNKTYGRKYVFTEEETITFINGIVKTSNDEISEVSPIQEWDKILKEAHLTACMTEAYAAKKVENYLKGNRFDADYVYDDDYASMRYSKVPKVKWIKSLDTTGFRDFCFDDKEITFGQINLFYGANGSGKTSVLEAIEYALTSEVRRVKDFKIKLPMDDYPKLSVYDTQAGVHTFTPSFSKRNCKEIERVWYGVPIGRNKSNLNENFNKFNAFDSEAAYKFIHESDNSEDSFSTMFGNLMFGESVVNHEKKWQRFKKAFNDRYTELRNELNEARNTAAYYEFYLESQNRDLKSEEIEKAIEEIKLKIRSRLPKEPSNRYTKILKEIKIVRKYVEEISSYHFDERSFSEIADEVSYVKKENLNYTKQKREKSEEITKLAKENSVLQKNIFTEEEKKKNIDQALDRVNKDIENWTTVKQVLKNKKTINLVKSLMEELARIDKELYYIAKIEQRTSIVKFLKLDKYEGISDEQKIKYKTEYIKMSQKKKQLENEYDELKKQFGEREQQTIELRKIGKTLIVNATCPLCGQKYDNIQQIMNIIDNVAIVDERMDDLITDIESITRRLYKLEKILNQQQMIESAKEELDKLKDDVPIIRDYRYDYRRIYEYLASKSNKEIRKTEIIEQQTVLDAQGFSIDIINACNLYRTTDPTYLEYKKSDKESYDLFLNNRQSKIQLELENVLHKIETNKQLIQKNKQKEELINADIYHLELKLKELDIDSNRRIDQALENLKTKFELPDNETYKEWTKRYYSLYDNCEIEIDNIKSQSMIAFEKQILSEKKAIIEQDEPMVERCAKAVQTFEKMPSLSSFVEKGIRSNIQQISKFFKWMHHSGEFEKLDIDEKGIYAIRGFNKEEVRTYEMSTGQRSTIAMAVMFALHMAAQDAPKFLLLDEPLATMDDTQVLNVLDILKSMAEQHTQIFFTTANGIMIKLFKECFKNTSFDYKEYQFIKRVNRPSEIKESSINETKTIEELTLDDLTLDFNQFAQIREILQRNQEKLTSQDDLEEIFDGTNNVSFIESTESAEKTENQFYSVLSENEKAILEILIIDQPKDVSTFMKLVASFPNYKAIIEQINDKSLNFYDETVIIDDDILPYVDEEYMDELRQQSQAN